MRSQTAVGPQLHHILMSLWILPRLIETATVMTPELLSTAELSQGPTALLSRNPSTPPPPRRQDGKLSTPTEIPRVNLRRDTKENPKWMKRDWTLVAGMSISSGMAVVTMMAGLAGSSLAWKPPWIC